MNFENILDEIEKVDPEVYDRLDTRRHAMQRFRTVGGRIALTALPFAIGAMFKKAYGQPTMSVAKGILMYALQLEYLEAAFYARGVANAATIGIPTGAAQTAIGKISADEAAHVNFLRTTIKSAGIGGTDADLVGKNIDLTGGGNATGTGPFAAAYQAGGYATFLALAQTFEDTGVRAYKGRAKELTRGSDYLQAALQIHSVEARHASHIRQMRFALNMAVNGQVVKPWITQNQTGITPTANTTANASITGAYNGATPESNVTQANIPITNIGGQVISADAASAAFDEPLTAAEVTAIVAPFLY